MVAWYLVPGTTGTWYLVITWYLVPSTYQGPGTWYLVPQVLGTWIHWRARYLGTWYHRYLVLGTTGTRFRWRAIGALLKYNRGYHDLAPHSADTILDASELLRGNGQFLALPWYV